MKWKSLIIVGIVLSLAGVAVAQTWNSPHQKRMQKNVRYGAFTGAPKTLDPARSYASNEWQFIAQIYEPPLQYHYLKRPFALEPLTLAKMPVVTYYNKRGQRLAQTVSPKKVAYSVYDLYLKPGILYQPHPAFAKDVQGRYRYHHLTQDDIAQRHVLSDFKQSGTRELTAADYAYQIKRLAHPDVNSPIFGLMSEYIVGLKAYAKQLAAIDKPFLDLRQHPLEGVKVISRYHYQIKIKGLYPQFKFWLAMPFFAPMPWEADTFYAQKGMKETNITLDWYPVGTGAYQLIKNDPNKEMVLARNPNFRGEKYPSKGMPGDRAKGYLKDAGNIMPFVDMYVFSLDKESIPRWNKFLQGYYDKSGISSDSFDQAIKLDRQGKPQLTQEMRDKNIQLQTTVGPAVYYIGFNMLDPVVGGYSKQQRLLRQAISVALAYEDFIEIFQNGRGKPAHGPIPPGIYGHRAGDINPVVYEKINGQQQRRPLVYAQRLLAEAGYPGGRDPKTGKALILNYDVAISGDPDDKARFSWFRKQFAQLGIELNIRATQYNRFQDKIRDGSAQIFSFGWLADYPDPENFLFLLYGPNGKVKHGGENAANYASKQFDGLFEDIKMLPNGPQRQQKIDAILKLIRKDSPWIWGFHPIQFSLSHHWNRVSKPHAMANNLLKYERLNHSVRHQQRKHWNKPVLWPLWALLGFVLVMLLPMIVTFWGRERRSNIKRDL